MNNDIKTQEVTINGEKKTIVIEVPMEENEDYLCDTMDLTEELKEVGNQNE
jgi:hypothetical protein